MTDLGGPRRVPDPTRIRKRRQVASIGLVLVPIRFRMGTMLIAMKVRAGTSGFSYKEWCGSFYPEKLKAAAMLDYYSNQLPTVELNNTFYRMPKADTVRVWRDQVPASFQFAVKASRRISHISRLAGVADAVGFLKQALLPLGPSLGLVLVQLPPNFQLDLDRLRDFFELWGSDVRLCLEFRHASWFHDSVFQLLKQHNVALCISDSESAGPPAQQFDPEKWATADFCYARLRRESYADTELSAWRDRLRRTGCKEAYVYFKHELLGPTYALRFNQLCENAS